ncbi:MAG: phosphate ABC transporter permease subunit PstC [Acidimicrobiia bacterium]
MAAPQGGFDLRGAPARHRKERIVKYVLLSAAVVTLAISAGFVVALTGKALEFLANIDLSLLWSRGWFPRRGLFDVRTLFVGTLMVTGIAMVVATPLGLGSAVYLSEYAGPRTRRILKPILEVLAGIPSIVLGFFALSWITPNIVQTFWSDAGAFNLMSAGIAVGVMITPLVATISEDAMRAVPHALREGSYGLGARKATTSIRVVFPAAISGIVASLILAASRAIGETMVVFIAAAASGGSLFTTNPLEAGQTMATAIASLATGSDQVAAGGGQDAGQAFNSLYFVGLLLFFFTLSLNMIGDRFVRRVRQVY